MVRNIDWVIAWNEKDGRYYLRRKAEEIAPLSLPVVD